MRIERKNGDDGTEIVEIYRSYYGNDGETLTERYEINDQEMRHGKYERWHPNGQKEWKGEYRNGSRHGKWVFWPNNRKGELFDKTGIMLIERWWDNGCYLCGKRYLANGDVWLIDEGFESVCLIGCGGE
jgi:antitoxin component YwqK of YwqJK toxin-antitoxin module